MSDESAEPTLFPTLLGIDKLKNTLTEKYRNIPNIRRLKESELVSIYNSMILPLSQREYAANYRGRRLKARRLKRGLEDKAVSPSIQCSGSALWDKIPSAANQNSAGDRLKPPPTSVCSTKIKLSRQSTPTNDSSKSSQRTASSESESNCKSLKRSDPPDDPTALNGASETTKKPKIEKITWP